MHICEEFQMFRAYQIQPGTHLLATSGVLNVDFFSTSEPKI